jgi:uncharacterized membrane protein (UPF0182 family)
MLMHPQAALNAAFIIMILTVLIGPTFVRSYLILILIRCSLITSMFHKVVSSFINFYIIVFIVLCHLNVLILVQMQARAILTVLRNLFVIKLLPGDLTAIRKLRRRVFITTCCQLNAGALFVHLYANMNLILYTVII